MKTFEGKLDAKEFKFAIVISRYNEFITKKLLEGALDCLYRHQCDEKNIEVAWVPGTFEIPSVVKIFVESKKYNSIICLGSIMKGDTQHNQYIANEVIKGIAKISLDFNVPVSFGVITPDTLEQAIDRAGARMGNKGWQAALSAIEMANLFQQLKN